MRKIFYVPGMMSALLIPVLFWYYGNQKMNEPITNIMDFGIPSKIDLKEESMNSGTSFESIRNWSYKKITGEAGNAKENSGLFVAEVKKLQKRNEAYTGIEFILDENNTYGDFVSLVNDMAIARHETYGLDINKTGHFFVPVIYKDPDAKNKEFEDECLLCNDVLYEVNETHSSWDEFLRFTYYYQTVFEDLSKLPKGAYSIIFGFLLFLNISMLSIKENLQIKRNQV